MINKTNKRCIEIENRKTFIITKEFIMTTLIITLAVFSAAMTFAGFLYDATAPQIEELPDLR